MPRRRKKKASSILEQQMTKRKKTNTTFPEEMRKYNTETRNRKKTSDYVKTERQKQEAYLEGIRRK